MNDNEAPKAGDILKTIHTMFGVSWDRVFQWVIVGCASAWFWIAVVLPSWHSEPRSVARPFSWFVDIAKDLAIPIPGWAHSGIAWFDSPERGWLSVVLASIAALCATCLVTSKASSGLVVLAVSSELAAIQITGDLRPVLWTFLFACIPFVGACVVALLQSARVVNDDTLRSHFFIQFIVSDFLVAGMSIIWQPVLAPFLGFFGLVSVFGRSDSSEPAEELVADAMRRLKERGGSLAESPAVDVLAVLVGLSLGTPTTWRRKWLASRIEYAITREPIGARVVSPDFTTAGQRWDDRTTG